MIKFTDPRLYVQGVGTAIMTDPATGDIKYFSDKFQDGNITASSDEGIINAGIGNAPAIMIPTNPNIQVSVTAADYSEYAKAAAVGATVTAGAPVMTCQTVQASGTSLSISVARAKSSSTSLNDNIMMIAVVRHRWLSGHFYLDLARKTTKSVRGLVKMMRPDTES